MLTFAISVLAFFYFLPTIIAASRGHKNSVPIFLTNLIFGATFIGWIISLIWSFTSNVKSEKQKEVNPSKFVKFLKFCAPTVAFVASLTLGTYFLLNSHNQVSEQAISQSSADDSVNLKNDNMGGSCYLVASLFRSVAVQRDSGVSEDEMIKMAGDSQSQIEIVKRVYSIPEVSPSVIAADALKSCLPKLQK